MNGLMKNFNVNETLEKDRIAQDFIKTVNPYRTKPSLGIDSDKFRLRIQGKEIISVLRYSVRREYCGYKVIYYRRLR